MERAIHKAAEEGDAALVGKIVKKAPALAGHARTKDGKAPLHVARGKAVAKLLIAAGADVNAFDHLGDGPLHATRDEEVAEALIEAGAKVDQPNANRYTPIQRTSSGPVARVLFRKGASLASEDPNDSAGYRNPFRLAVEQGRGETALALLSLGADYTTFRDKTALHFAAHSGDKALIEALLDKGVDVNAAERMTQATPLHHAVLQDKVEAAEALLTRGANPNVALSGMASVTTITMSGGMGLKTSDAGGSTPIKLAKSDAMRALLRKHGAAD